VRVQSTAMDQTGPIKPTEEDDEMNMKISTRKIIMQWVAVTGMIMATATVQADRLSSALYGDELDRCTVELRPELDLTGVTRLQHALTEIDKVGVWYVFEIRTLAYDDTDTVMTTATTHCKAHRWTGETVVEVTIEPSAGRVGEILTRIAAAD
jgi:hypothetical protein